MNISGKIKLIGETKEYGANGFRKRELVVTTQESIHKIYWLNLFKIDVKF